MELTQVVFISTRLPVKDLTSCIYKMRDSSALQSSEIFSQLTLKCRQLLFEYPGVVATCPMFDSRCLLVTCPLGLMSEERFSHLVNTKLGLVLEKQVSTTPALMRDSVSYTLQARLAPAWNKVGDWLLQGRQVIIVIISGTFTILYSPVSPCVQPH